MKNSVKWTVPLLVLFSLGCGGEKDEEGSYADYEISSEPLSGVINGEAWTFVSGTAQDIFDDGELWVDLYASAPSGDDPCSISAHGFEETSIIMSVPAEELDRELGLSTTVTFYYEDGGEPTNEIVTEGRLIIDEVTDETMSGRLFATADGGEVDGTFSVTICEFGF